MKTCNEHRKLWQCFLDRRPVYYLGQWWVVNEWHRNGSYKRVTRVVMRDTDGNSRQFELESDPCVEPYQDGWRALPPEHVGDAAPKAIIHYASEDERRRMRDEIETAIRREARGMWWEKIAIDAVRSVKR